MMIPLARPDIGEDEIRAVIAVLESGVLSRGQQIDALEQAFIDYTGSRHAIAMSSGTATLHCTLQALGIGPGDEVITTPYSVPATINPILAAGASPVLVDIDRDTLGLNAEIIESQLTDRTRAVMAVYPFGMPIDIEPIQQLCSRAGLHLIEDSCEALGTRINGQHVGRFGVTGCFGLYPNKQITAGEGGVCITDDESLASELRMLRNHGRSMDGSWLDQRRVGHNFRLTEMQAALGVTQMNRLPDILHQRRVVADRYCSMFENESRLHCPASRQLKDDNFDTSLFCFQVELLELPHDFETRADYRDTILRELTSMGIQCSRYFAPLHLQPALSGILNSQLGDFPVCESVASSSITLPFFTTLTEAEQSRVVDSLTTALDRSG